MRTPIKPKRIVIKIGTAVISGPKGKINKDFFKNLSKQIKDLRKEGIEVMIVSSGAIGAGMNELKILQRPQGINARQMCASVGQTIILNYYRKIFSKKNLKIGQVLVTRDIFSDRNHFLNLKNCTKELLKNNIIPVFNENDVVAVDEIDKSFGDNDLLSSLIASNFNADLLIMISKTDGLYTTNPKEKNAEKITDIEGFDKNLFSYAKGKSALGSGGMESKILAAKNCLDEGIDMAIIPGEKNSIMKLLKGDLIGTYFHSKITDNNTEKKKWIKQSVSKGMIKINKKAKEALYNGKNLLLIGVLDADKTFFSGDVVELSCEDKTFAKIITNYSSKEIMMLKGFSNQKIKKQTGLLKVKNINSKENIVFL